MYLMREACEVIYDLALIIGMSIVYISEALISSIIPRRFRQKSVNGEIALVTGGARGIGKLIAMKLAKLGVNVVVWDIDKFGMQQVVEDIKQSGGKAWGYYCDIGSKEDVYRTAKTVEIEVGKVTILINNAGYVYGDTLMNLPDHEIEKTFRINILSHYWISKAFLKDMMRDNYGHVVTIASLAGLMGTYNCTDYSASKFATVGFHESLFTELKCHGYDGINLTLICPYLINTGMFNGVNPKMPMLEPEYVASEVVSALLTNELFVTMPRNVRYLLPFKSLLPGKLSWSLMYDIMKGPQAMMSLNLRSNKEVKENNNYKFDVKAK